jgi:uncharacterized protein YndB with AHSA1/START domain
VAGQGRDETRERQMTDATGATVDIEIVVSKGPDEMWDLVTDVARVGEWSPECKGGAWLEGAGPEPGARFEGYNEFPSFKSTTTCVVTEAARPSVFEWIVLDPSLDPASPGSIWRYEIEPDAEHGKTVVRHRFVHGPGVTGLKRGMEEDPDEASAILQERLDLLRKHMTITLEGMAAS